VRPLRVEVKGFSAFREATEVSFEGADLVALVGPTGSGKSSLIDAITFALYGVISRYDDLRAVEPVIHQLETEARVRLDFELGGERYTAVRVVRRQPRGGATTKEARLVQWSGDAETVLAESARSMPAAIDELLHLSFEQFTKTVVLPQGDFAAFLREGPKERQELLRRLLDVEVYNRMGERARTRSRTAENGRLLRVEERDRLTVLSDADRAALGTRAEALAALGPVVDGHLAEVNRLVAERERAKGELAAASADHAALVALVVPDGVADLAGSLERAIAAVDAADMALTTAQDARDAAEKLAAAVDAAAVERALERLQDRARRREELGAVDGRIVEATGVAERAAGALAEADVALDAARAAHDRARAADLAGSLVATLVVGEPCPVCRRDVDALPDHDVAAELAGAASALDAAMATQREAAQAATAAARALDGLRDQHVRMTEELATLEAQVGPGVDVAALEGERQRAVALRTAVVDARAAVTDAERARAHAQKELTAARAKEAGERRHLTEARDAVSARKPPAPEGSSLHADWVALVAWATSTAVAVETEVAAARARVDEIHRQSVELRAALDAACEPWGIAVKPVEDLVRRVASAAAATAVEVARADEDRSRAAVLDATISGLSATAEVAATMGRLLNAQGFERWLLQAALDDLVARATERLLELSGGQFSLLTDDGELFVRDHRNADERRGVRTLSGGETFLASLALALALAENVAELAAEGGPKLESMFLDEGFGTLDPDTLDLVAASVEELSASGRFVAIVTHIRELADRVPVRFEVTKDATTSRVTRVET